MNNIEIGRTGTAVTALLGGLLGAYSGGGLVVGAIGAIAGGLLGNFALQDIFIKIAQSLNLTSDSIPAVSVTADSDVSTTKAVAVEQGKGKQPYQGNLLLPNQERFDMKMDVGTVAGLSEMRQRIESLPVGLERQGAIANFSETRDNAYKFALNIDEWNRRATLWNEKEQPKLAAAVEAQHKALGKPGEPVPMAPIVKLEYPEMPPSLLDYGRALQGGKIDDATLKSFAGMNSLSDKIDGQIKINENIDWNKTLTRGVIYDRSDTWSTATSSFITGNLSYLTGAEKVMPDAAHTITDCSHWCRDYLKSNDYQHAMQYAKLGYEKAKHGIGTIDDDQETMNEYSKVIEYIRAKEARQQLDGLYDQIHRNIASAKTLPESTFKPFLQEVEKLEASVTEGNKQILAPAKPEKAAEPAKPKPPITTGMLETLDRGALDSIAFVDVGNAPETLSPGNAIPSAKTSTPEKKNPFKNQSSNIHNMG